MVRDPLMGARQFSQMAVQSLEEAFKITVSLFVSE